MRIHGSKIRVEIQETYKGSMHYWVRIYLPGMGANHKGFVLCNVEQLERKLGEDWNAFVGDTTQRPEYAMAIKEALEGEESTNA